MSAHGSNIAETKVNKNYMRPSTFYQLSQTNQLKLLYFDAVYIREREKGSFTIRLFMFGSYYYEIWQLKSNGKLHCINYLDDNDAATLFPGVSEWKVGRH